VVLSNGVHSITWFARLRCFAGRGSLLYTGDAESHNPASLLWSDFGVQLVISRFVSRGVCALHSRDANKEEPDGLAPLSSVVMARWRTRRPRMTASCIQVSCRAMAEWCGYLGKLRITKTWKTTILFKF
jgi:hypothetical protein